MFQLTNKKNASICCLAYYMILYVSAHKTCLTYMNTQCYDYVLSLHFDFYDKLNIFFSYKYKLNMFMNKYCESPI